MLNNIIIIVLMIIVSILLFCIYIANKLSSPKRVLLQSNPKKEIGLDYEDIEFKVEEQKLKGWYIDSKQNKFTIVFAHGYNSNRENYSSNGYEFIKYINSIGGNYLSFDFRGQGESDGKKVTVGYNEKKDIESAINFAKKKSKAPIILYGVSMGAATSILAAENNKEIVGVIADSPFCSLKQYLSRNFSVWTNMPKFFSEKILLNLLPYIMKISYDEIMPIKSIKNIKVPVLLIHSKGDRVIPYSESEKLYKANRKNKLFLFENKGHIKSFKEEPENYKKNIGAFLNCLK